MPWNVLQCFLPRDNKSSCHPILYCREPGNVWSSKVFLLNHLDYVSLNSNPWDGNAPSLGNSWEPPRGKTICVKTLPPTDANLVYHILRADYQVMLWKAADQQTPPAGDIAAYGWVLISGAVCVPTPRIARGPAAHPALMDVINCQCKAVGKACSSHTCSCHSAGLSCTPYCYCVGEAMCFNPQSIQPFSLYCP